ncbi:hypothetical protein KC343_g4361 [Hortaea werneckii]|uniref:BTB domain-containing protein n=1 Tax=Hortaea werneckii TaxID=91943 RepID=A0A3M7H1V6_HORWE|nr:hypothetical protein KC323_g4949 [Hortaea werneckii]KAI7248625.1 hypothetical protein KC352_g13347 [Hortaea werneckii]KAI7564642.1 hypothetical protein KC317_g6922 [Hortaea werneckii]KAI7621794.1 hypothetical protein KC346_g3509 [Hortaea werneckii]KAI7630890.1 hypothetical protein KC343_g4361 [Hortaea werneckii]
MDDEPEFAEALTTDRVIKVYVGEGKPFLVQQLLLESLSTYFARALKRDTFSEGIHGELRIEGDDRRTWQALLHWLFKGMLPAKVQEDPVRLIDLWIVGDKYGVEILQNDAMYTLLKYVDIGRGGTFLPIVTIKDGLDRTSPGTVMRKLLAQEIYHAVHSGGLVRHEDLATWDTVGLASDLLKASDDRDKYGQFFLDRFDEEDMLWKDFMLGSDGLGRDQLASQRRNKKRIKTSFKRLRDD